jgi:hypothetical protein
VGNHGIDENIQTSKWIGGNQDGEGIRSAQRTDAIRRGKREPETKILSKGKKMLEEGRRL